MKAFFSYHFPKPDEDTTVSDEALVTRVCYYLQTQSPINVYLYIHERRAGQFTEHLATEINCECDSFVLFVSSTWGETQRKEAALAYERHKKSRLSTNTRPISLLVVSTSKECAFPMAGDSQIDEWINHFKDIDPIRCDDAFEIDAQGCHVHEGNAQKTAQEICNRLGMGTNWLPDFEIPPNYPFPNEKKIIEEYIRGEGTLSDEWLLQGCPGSWPNIKKKQAIWQNLVPPQLIGNFSSEESRVVVDVRAYLLDKLPGSRSRDLLTFAEARPRQMLCLPHRHRLDQPGRGLNVGVLVSGGIAPGINSVLSGIVERHTLYQRWATKSDHPEPINYSLEIHGYLNGFRSLEHEPLKPLRLDNEDFRRRVRDEANRGGSLLGTSRMDALLGSNVPSERSKRFSSMIKNLKSAAIDILYVIGGDGSMRAAHALQVAAQREGYELAVVGIPKTMDNDILWVWQSFGFLSAVEKAKEFIMQLHTEATSNPRLCVMQLFGSDSGFIVSHAALASGVVDLALIPEVDFSMRKVSDYLKKKLGKLYTDGRSPSGLVLMSETAIPTDVLEYIDRDEKLAEKDKVLRLDQEEKIEIFRFLDNNRRVRGQTPDALRTGGLKIVSRILQDEIKKMRGEYWQGFRVFTNEPRHLLRSLEPSSSDIIFGHRLGCLAVDNAMAGYSDFMVSQWLTEFVLVPLRLVVLGRKRVPPDGIFWRSVLDSTGQDAVLH